MDNIQAIAVFCGSRDGHDPAHRAAAAELGRALAKRSIRLVFGGGRIGLMGAVADAVLGAGGEAIGVIPEFLTRHEVAHTGVTELRQTESMHERKNTMFSLSDAFVILPGGIGTLDEAFEVISWKQLRLHAKPIIVLDANGYWAPFAALIAATVGGGFAHEGVNGLFTAVKTVDEVFTAIANAPAPDRAVLESHF